MARKKLYVIHATVNYVVQSKATGQTENGTCRPTIAVEATSEPRDKQTTTSRRV